MNFLDKVLKIFTPYPGLSVKVYFHEDHPAAWKQFQDKYHPILETICSEPWRKESFDTFDMTIKGLKIRGYSPDYPNPNYDPMRDKENQRETRKREREQLKKQYREEFGASAELPLIEQIGTKNEVEFSRILKETGKASNRRELYSNLVKRLVEAGWSLGEKSSYEDYSKAHLLIVKAPDEEQWSLIHVPVKHSMEKAEG